MNHRLDVPLHAFRTETFRASFSKNTPCSAIADTGRDQDVDTPNGETWRLKTNAGPADQVYLAIDGPSTTGRWIEMKPVAGEPGTWSVLATLLPGRHRLRYFTVENGTTLNCGSVGLYGERMSAQNPAVQIDDFEAMAASA